jgi:TolB-like protein
MAWAPPTASRFSKWCKKGDNQRMASFFSELRRRNVLRLAATYALAGWILIEAGSVLLPTFGVPDWFFRVYVLVIFAGFVVALILAWVFEITPDGVKRERDIDRAHQATVPRSRSNAIIIGLLAIALTVSITFNVTGLRDEGTPDAAVRNLSSVAVLPFTSRSSDPENRYFADGIQDDLLTRLADIESLRVISRTSVNEYRDTARNLREIGAELGVDTVVEGAVQRAGSQVRITVQLIDARTDEHLWADSFDRELTTENLFAIQSEISSRIASALQAALTPEEELRLAAMPTKSLEALSQYSAARNNLYLRRFDALLEARAQFERAVELDPGYAQAWAGLAETILVLESNHGAVDLGDAVELATQAAERALELDDQLAEAHAVTGLIELRKWGITRVGRANQAAAAAFERALDLNPNLANAYIWYALLREAEDNTEAAAELLTQAMRIDPLSRVPYLNLPGLYATQGKPEKALDLLVKAMDIFPDWPFPYTFLAEHLEALGRLDEAIAWATRAQAKSADPAAGMRVIGSYLEFGNIEKIDEIAGQLPADNIYRRIGDAYMTFADGDYPAAIEAFEGLELAPEEELKYAYPMLSISWLKLRDYAKARDYLVRSNPLLAADTADSVDRQNLRSAIMLAFIFRQTGDERRADRLLAEAERVVARLPRMGITGYGISDVKILIVQGRHDAALRALRNAIDDGFISMTAHQAWTLDQDPVIDEVRKDDRFKAMKQELNIKIEAMRENVERAEATGDWNELLRRVRGENLTASLAGR